MRYLLALLLVLVSTGAGADVLVLSDGSAMQHCFVRDEGTRVLIWDRMDQVGGPAREIPRSHVKELKIERDDAWDAKPDLPDLSVTHIELTPRLPGLHGVVEYDQFGRPRITGAKALTEIGDRAYTNPEQSVKGLQFAYKPGQQVTLIAHVKNVGFRDSGSFEYEWLMNGKRLNGGRHRGPVKEMVEVTFTQKWVWEPGRNTVTFRIRPAGREIATINDEATDHLWGFAFFYVVSKGRVNAWHQFRSAAGTFCFEDYYRWHLDIMNRLFAASIYPSAPEGILARVRLDRIIYADDVDKAVQSLREADGLGYHQGGWIWTDSPEEKQGKWNQVNREWRCATEWSLPHELGHQLGLVDYYALDYGGHEDHVMPDNGEKITHFQRHPVTMMHWHGPHPYNETDAGYLNMTIDKPRGHFGDYYFAIPNEVWLRIVDVNGGGVGNATVECFQRGVEVDKTGQPAKDGEAIYYPVLEDGNFDRPVSRDPVIVGKTDASGRIRLPNRPVVPVRTLNGFERKPNPFGNINVVGGRGLMLIRITLNGRQSHFWLEAWDLNVLWFRGQKERCEIVLRTPYGSIDSPPSPRDVKASESAEGKVAVSWNSPTTPREGVYLDRVIGYRVYRRISSDGLNDRPWHPVATLGPSERSVVVDLKSTLVDDTYWFSRTNRFAVSAIGESGRESELVESPPLTGK
jgi:hypothetical protein